MKVKIQKRLFGTNGIRGKVNEDLSPELVLQIAEAIGTFFNKGNILLGYDGRISNYMFANAMMSGLMSTGCTVYEGGMAPTPCIQYAVKHHDMDGGIMITASHNPPEYNGVKVLGQDGVEISRRQEVRIENIYFDERVKYAPWSAIGRHASLTGILDEYRQVGTADLRAIPLLPFLQFPLHLLAQLLSEDRLYRQCT